MWADRSVTDRLDYKFLFYFWLNAVSTAVATGNEEMAGGQRHFALGRSGNELRRFFSDSPTQQIDRKWSFVVEAYGDLPRHEFVIQENSPRQRRPHECRLTGQWPRSRRPYPLWQRAVVPIEANSLPRQVVTLLRDHADRFYIRLLSTETLNCLSSQAEEQMLADRVHARRHLLDKGDGFTDLPPPSEAPVEGTSGLVIGPENTKPSPESDEGWSALAEQVRRAEGRPRARRIQQVERALRSPGVREIALRCFGERCQVRGCIFTVGLSAEYLKYVLEVHHVRAVSQGGSDSVYNLAVLCANHHSLIERLPDKEVIETPNRDDIALRYPGGSIVIERNLDTLRERLA